MVTELRDYRIQEGQLDRFVTEWGREVRPLRQHAFTVDGAWTVEGESRFIWLLSYEGSWASSRPPTKPTTLHRSAKGWFLTRRA